MHIEILTRFLHAHKRTQMLILAISLLVLCGVSYAVWRMKSETPVRDLGDRVHSLVESEVQNLKGELEQFNRSIVVMKDHAENATRVFNTTCKHIDELTIWLRWGIVIVVICCIAGVVRYIFR